MKVVCELHLCILFCKSEAVRFLTSKQFYPLVAEKYSTVAITYITLIAALTSAHAREYFCVWVQSLTCVSKSEVYVRAPSRVCQRKQKKLLAKKHFNTISSEEKKLNELFYIMFPFNFDWALQMSRQVSWSGIVSSSSPSSLSSSSSTFVSRTACHCCT